jgi:hypothetical protein
LDPRLRRALSQALRVEILERIAARPASARQIAEACGEPLSKITYHTSVLADTGCIRPAEPTTSDPGERVYEIAKLMPEPERLPLSDSTRGQVLASVLRRILDRASAALDAGTLGGRDDGIVSCESIVLDQRGWRETKTILDETARQLAAVKSAAADRLAESRKSGFLATVAIAAFESPSDE